MNLNEKENEQRDYDLIDAQENIKTKLDDITTQLDVSHFKQ